MNRQVLIVNITRMGDLVQTGPLIGRLQEEWPGVAVDVVVDRTFAPMAELLPGVRHVLPYDFQGLIDRSRVRMADVVAIHRDMAAWGWPLVEARYDRVINLTFNQRSAFLSSYVGAPDVRGAAAARDGGMRLHNPWMSYFVDLHRHRRFNAFNIVDLFALGGSGPGRFVPMALSVDRTAADWAGSFLAGAGAPQTWIGIQVGASEVIKAWRPHYFGEVMAALAATGPVGFVMIGGAQEAGAVREAVEAYRAAARAAGTPERPVCDAVGRTSLPQLVALLARCRLLLTNDTGPMHLAVSVGTPVVDLSVGHVDYKETGPYGPGHWVVQPDLDCAPCGFDTVCPHHACKDRVDIAGVAALARHALGAGDLPTRVGGVRVYRAETDEDGLCAYRLAAGTEGAMERWYKPFWRRFWYETLTGRPSASPAPEGLPPDWESVRPLAGWMASQARDLATRMRQVAKGCRQMRPDVRALNQAQGALADATARVVETAMRTAAFGEVTVALMRDKQNVDGIGLGELAAQQAAAYERFERRVGTIARTLGGADQRTGAGRTAARRLSEEERMVCHASHA